MDYIRTVIFVGWIVFWVYWFAMATRAKRMMVRTGPAVGARLVIFLFVIIALRLSYHRVTPLGQVVSSDVRLVLALVGLVLFVAGLGLAIWARVYLGRDWGMPMSERADPDLVTTGPYSYIRHPIYTGILLASLATASVAGLYWLVISVLMGAYFIYAAKQEETYLLQTFPKAYPKYVHTTKMLIPFVF